jgi:hypothetical protein
MAGISYGQQTQLHFIDGNLNALRRAPEAHFHAIHPPPSPQHDNARPHVLRICTQFLESENVPVLPWPAYSPDMSPIELFGMLWIDVVKEMLT